MTKTLLISEQTIKKNTAINDNVDSKIVYQTIRQVQDIDLDSLIGPALNQKLQNLVKTGDITQTQYSDYKELLDEYIAPYMCAMVQAAIQIYVNYKIVNSGVIQNDDDKRSHLDYQSNKNLQAQYEKYASSYAMKLKNHLCCNSSKYPEYHTMFEHQGEEDPQLCSIFLEGNPNRYNYIGK